LALREEQKVKVVLSLSGGIDSTTLCAYYLEKGYDVLPISFRYGSKHNEYENDAAVLVAQSLNVPEPQLIDLNFIGDLFKSDLLLTGGDIPEGHYADDSMQATVVPVRNFIFASIIAGYAESIGVDIISLGVHGGDHHIYPDCRPEFIASLNTSVILATDKKVRVETPFLYCTKAEIIKTGINLKNVKVPYGLTRTCYRDQELACGKCGSCVERIEAFELVGMEDPIEYET